MQKEMLLDSPRGQTLELRGRRRLIVHRQDHSDILRLLGNEGETSLTIEVTERGTILRFSGAALTFQAGGNLSIEADRISLHGRSGLSLTSGGDVRILTPADLRSEARIQTVKATLGNVNIKANDDVRINGERVMVNC